MSKTTRTGVHFHAKQKHNTRNTDDAIFRNGVCYVRTNVYLRARKAELDMREQLSELHDDGMAWQRRRVTTIGNVRWTGFTMNWTDPQTQIVWRYRPARLMHLRNEGPTSCTSESPGYAFCEGRRVSLEDVVIERKPVIQHAIPRKQRIQPHVRKPRTLTDDERTAAIKREQIARYGFVSAIRG